MVRFLSFRMVRYRSVIGLVSVWYRAKTHPAYAPLILFRVSHRCCSMLYLLLPHPPQSTSLVFVTVALSFVTLVDLRRESLFLVGVLVDLAPTPHPCRSLRWLPSLHTSEYR